LKELGGITLAGPEPAALTAKFEALWAARDSVNGAALAVALLCIGTILITRAINVRWPAFLFAVAACSGAAYFWGLPAETIGTRFGGIPHGLPMPHLPEVSLARMWALLPSAISLAVLGAIESLLSATVADAMKGRQHRPGAELVAQGVANIAAPLFGGITATGTIARTATNVRAGAHGPVSGVLHAAFVLLAMLVAAPVLGHVPLAALAGILTIVSWNMFERAEMLRLLRRWPTALVLLVTVGLTVFVDLLSGIAAGTVLSKLLSLFDRRDDNKHV
jgi:sulfate permease, SulP family